MARLLRVGYPEDDRPPRGIDIEAVDSHVCGLAPLSREWQAIAACWGEVKILFVENHQVFAETVIAQFLSGHDVVVAPTVADAKRALSAAFDAVLVDYDLPDGKGTEVVRALRAIGFRGRIVAVSSREEGNLELRAAGAKVVCSKKDFRAIGAALGG